MDIHALVEAQHKYYQSGATRPVEFRIEALRKLQRAIRANATASSTNSSSPVAP